MVALNRAIAVAQVDGPESGLRGLIPSDICDAQAALDDVRNSRAFSHSGR